MAIRIDGVTYRNIQEQVEKNKRDIAAWTNIQFTLNSFGITVLGKVDTEVDIPEGTYSYGDAYLVGEEEPYDIYIFTRDGEDGEFVNMGPLSIVGPQGPQGEEGVQGPSGTIEVGTVTTGAAGSNAQVTNAGTSTAAIFNFVIPRGATGAQGERGPIGETGERGPIGETGPQGDPGESFMIVGTIINISQLPDPTETPRNHAYVLKDSDPDTADLLYYITGTAGSEVWSSSTFAGAGTTVSVNGNPVSTFNADTKLDKVTSATTYRQAYIKNADGTQDRINVVDSASGYTIPLRGSTGQLAVPLTPTSNEHATAKKYVDDTDNKVLYKLGAYDTITASDSISVTISRKTEYIDLTALTWTSSQIGTSGKYRYISSSLATVIKKPSTNTEAGNILCPLYTAVSANATYLNNEGISITTTGDIYIYDNTLSQTDDLSGFLAKIATYNVCYELATASTEKIIKDEVYRDEPTLLWSNSSPTSNFADQTINDLPLSGFKFIAVEYCQTTTSTHQVSIAKLSNTSGNKTRLLYVTDDAYRFRELEIGSNSITFGVGYKVVISSGALSSGADIIIPVAIYGSNSL